MFLFTFFLVTLNQHPDTMNRLCDWMASAFSCLDQIKIVTLK